MDYGYYGGYDSGVAEVLSIFFGVFMVAFAIAALVGLTVYILNAIGLYTISKKRGYKNAWLAFIPIGNYFVLGGIADNITACYGKRTNHRIILLVSSIASSICASISSGYFFNMLIELISEATYGYGGYGYGYGYENLVFASVWPIINLAIAVVAVVFYYIACHKIFSDYSQNGSLWTVLSILFGIAPFVIFALRNKNSASLAYMNSMAYQNGQQYTTVPPAYQQSQAPMYPQAPPQGGMYPQSQQPLYPQAPIQGGMYQVPQQPQQPQHPQQPQQPMTPPAPPQPATPPAQNTAENNENQQQ